MRLSPGNSLLCVIDVQERLLAVIPEAERLVARVARLAEAARLLGVPATLTEQYPQGLGATAAVLRPTLPAPETKLRFSCVGCPGFDAATAGVGSVIVCGLETHVCVSQTALDLLARGVVVFVAVDAVASRHPLDHDVALRRLEGAGAILSTTEAILFEWCRSADHPAFQTVRKLVVAPRPAG